MFFCVCGFVCAFRLGFFIVLVFLWVFFFFLVKIEVTDPIACAIIPVLKLSYCYNIG